MGLPLEFGWVLRAKDVEFPVWFVNQLLNRFLLGLLIREHLADEVAPGLQAKIRATVLDYLEAEIGFWRAAEKGDQVLDI